jgi:2-succinyl-5-enolpyruvyl-6-hydroxy-3-cyclohexene-1-carboxylate synthase
VDDRNFLFTVSLVSALADCGVTEAAVSPGSRNTPVSMSLAAEGRICDRSFHDERSAGFFALGVGKVSGIPALVSCTSGTAAAEVHPAVVEARYGRVPLIVITADRPSELWETGAPQTIDQRLIYGSAPIWAHDIDIPSPGETRPGFPAALAARLVAEARRGPGPTHLNLRFREPLVPLSGMPPPTGTAPAVDIAIPTPTAETVASLAADLGGRRGIIVAGPHHDPGLAAPAAAAASALGFPVLADPQSGLRAGAHGRDTVMGAPAALAAAGFLDRARPEAVLRIGPPPTSRPLWEWLAAHPEIHQIHLDDLGWRDPGASARRVVGADPAAVLGLVAAAAPLRSPDGWLARWQQADRRALAAIGAAVNAHPFPTEPGIALLVTGALAEGSLLYVASSMPIRDVDLCLAPTDRGIRILSNRGANGIDGFLSSGFGAAAVWPGPSVLLAGDLSVLHDLTALAAAARHRIPATVVVVDNDGGGIFHFLPQAGFPEVFERHFGTPHGLDLVELSRALGVPAAGIENPDDLIAATRGAEGREGPNLVVVRTDRGANVAVHRAIAAAVDSALAGC